MAYLDPGNIEADLQAGAIRDSCNDDKEGASAYSKLWLLMWGHFIGWVFQVLAARVGNVANADLATYEKRSLAVSLSFSVSV